PDVVAPAVRTERAGVEVRPTAGVAPLDQQATRTSGGPVLLGLVVGVRQVEARRGRHHGSFGRPSSRSAMTLRCTSLVPPAMVRQRFARNPPSHDAASPSTALDAAPNSVRPTSDTR